MIKKPTCKCGSEMKASREYVSNHTKVVEYECPNVVIYENELQHSNIITAGSLREESK